MEAIRFEQNTLFLLDQTKLPQTILWREYKDYVSVADAIQTMVVRGAPAIGIAAAYACVLASLQFHNSDFHVFQSQMTEAIKTLAATRPTAVNLFWALDRMSRRLKTISLDEDVSAALLNEAISIHQEDIEMNRTMGRLGASVVPQGAGILTHCNAGALATGGYGTALGVIRAAHALGRVSMVYADETRPLLQGARLTAFELHEDGIPVTVIADNMAGSLMAAGKIQMVILGCDRMASNGDFANKIGTYSLAVLAKHHGIPFYTALPVSTIDMGIKDGSEIMIEQRAKEEITAFMGQRTAPEGVGAYNPAFDVTPHSLLTGIITDRGVLYPPFKENLLALEF